MKSVRHNTITWWQPSRRGWSILLLYFGLAMQLGCGNSAESIPADDLEATRDEIDSSSKAEASLSSKIKFKTSNGKVTFSIKPEADGGKLVDANEQEIARFNLSGTKLKVKDADDAVLGYVIASEGKYKIEDADNESELWKLQRQDDGDWKLEDGRGQLVCKVKVREYGFEIEDVAENSSFKIKLKDGKTSLRDQSDQTVYYTKDQVPTIAVACLGFEMIESLPLRVALMTMMVISGGK